MAEAAGALFGGLGATLELRGELLDAASGVDETLLAGVGGMRVHRHVAEHHKVLLTVDRFLTGGLHRRLGEVALARSDIEEANVVERGMAFGFHRKKGLEVQPWRAL